MLLRCGGHDRIGLAVTDLRLDEAAVPLPFVVAIHNDGDEPVEIQGVSVNETRTNVSN
jgi:hypothetical protein